MVDVEKHNNAIGSTNQDRNEMVYRCVVRIIDEIRTFDAADRERILETVVVFFS